MNDCLFFFAEVWHMGPGEVLSMSISRRAYLMEKKSDLEEDRAKRQKAASSRARARRR